MVEVYGPGYVLSAVVGRLSVSMCVTDAGDREFGSEAVCFCQGPVIAMTTN